MDTTPLVAALDRFRAVLPALCSTLTDDDARWRPDDGAWSILEIVRHLEDEEREDFPDRLRRMLADPNGEWPPIDPAGWAVDRRYNDDDLAASLDRFDALRADAIARLRETIARDPAPDWSAVRVHPVAGPLHAGDLLAAWVAHDALHLRQIAKRMHQLVTHHAAPYESRYAGDWTA